MMDCVGLELSWIALLTNRLPKRPGWPRWLTLLIDSLRDSTGIGTSLVQRQGDKQPVEKVLDGPEGEEAANVRRQIADLSARQVGLWQRSDCRMMPFAPQMTFLSVLLSKALATFTQKTA